MEREELEGRRKQEAEKSRPEQLPACSAIYANVGPIGLMCMLAARASGASHIIASDLVDSRLEVAKRLGANTTFNVRSGKQLDEEIKSGAIPTPRVTIECSGAQAAIRSAILVRRSTRLDDGGSVWSQWGRGWRLREREVMESDRTCVCLGLVSDVGPRTWFRDLA